MKAVVSDEIHAPLQVELVTRIDKDDEGCSEDLGKNNWVNSCGAGLWPALHNAGGTPAPQYENDQLISARLLRAYLRSRSSCFDRLSTNGKASTN